MGSADSTILISRIAPAEMVSAFAIKTRTGVLSKTTAEAVIAQFQADCRAGRFTVLPVQERDFALSERLMARHAFDLRLRALDGLHLALAVNFGTLDYFVSADHVLCDTAQVEGLAVLNPEML